jgi:hypothetical protein
MTYPSVDAPLAGEVLEAAGCPGGGVAETVLALRRWLPAGSTSKWLAVDRGDVPPGADPTTALEARLAGSLESWSCWAICTSVGAVLAGAGHDVSLVVEHHRRSDVVDFHSVLVVDGQLLDPYLGPSWPVPPGGDVTRPDAWAAWVPGDGPGRRPDHLGVRGGGTPYRYRLLGERLGPREVDAFCRVSETHSGVGRRRTAHWIDADERLWTVREGDDRSAELRVAEGVSPFDQTRRVVEEGPYDELRRRIDAPVGEAA